MIKIATVLLRYPKTMGMRFIPGLRRCNMYCDNEMIVTATMRSRSTSGKHDKCDAHMVCTNLRMYYDDAMITTVTTLSTSTISKQGKRDVYPVCTGHKMLVGWFPLSEEWLTIMDTKFHACSWQKIFMQMRFVPCLEETRDAISWCGDLDHNRAFAIIIIKARWM